MYKRQIYNIIVNVKHLSFVKQNVTFNIFKFYYNISLEIFIIVRTFELIYTYSFYTCLLYTSGCRKSAPTRERKSNKVIERWSKGKQSTLRKRFAWPVRMCKESEIQLAMQQLHIKKVISLELEMPILSVKEMDRRVNQEIKYRSIWIYTTFSAHLLS